METGKRQKYFVNRKEAVNIRCQHCGRMRTVEVESLKNKIHTLTINCPCSETFEVVLEFRQDYREKTNIRGYYRALTTPRARARHCVIADRSSGGLLLRVTEEVPIRENDRVIVSYRPDSRFSQEIEQIIRVCHYAPGRSLGGAFIDVLPPQGTRAPNPTVH